MVIGEFGVRSSEFGVWSSEFGVMIFVIKELFSEARIDLNMPTGLLMHFR